MTWRNAKGFKDEVFCNECGKTVYHAEYDFVEDKCLFCLFPQTSPYRPAEVAHDHGFVQNVTDDRKFLDVVESIPEVQSAQAEANLNRRRAFNAKKKAKS